MYKQYVGIEISIRRQCKEAKLKRHHWDSYP